MFTRARWVIGLGAAAALLIACSSGDDTTSSGDEAEPTAKPGTTSQPTAAANGAAATAAAFQTSAATTVKITVSSPVARNANATVSVETAPGADCRVEYTTPSKTLSEAAGLEKKKADANGKATWTWTIGPSTQPGTGQVRVWCNNQDDVQTIVIT